MILSLMLLLAVIFVTCAGGFLGFWVGMIFVMVFGRDWELEALGPLYLGVVAGGVCGFVASFMWAVTY